MPRAKKVEIKILLPIAGKFHLSHNVGDKVKMEAKQAKELVTAKYAEYVK